MEKEKERLCSCGCVCMSVYEFISWCVCEYMLIVCLLVCEPRRKIGDGVRVKSIETSMKGCIR